MGCAGAFSLRTTVPGGAATGMVGTAGITTVGVLPTHRRQGITRQLMGRLLEQAHEREEPLASLFASQGAIYGRFGFGVATTLLDLDVLVERASFVPSYAPHGRTRLLDRAEALPRMHRRVRGGGGSATGDDRPQRGGLRVAASRAREARGQEVLRRPRGRRRRARRVRGLQRQARVARGLAARRAQDPEPVRRDSAGRGGHVAVPAGHRPRVEGDRGEPGDRRTVAMVPQRAPRHADQALRRHVRAAGGRRGRPRGAILCGRRPPRAPRHRSVRPAERGDLRARCRRRRGAVRDGPTRSPSSRRT